ncbi:MAG: hypothetical protein EFKGCFLK_02344 [Rhodocyclaceae bacterium]|nr:hypothetical protein [Rhodocyclaceae bacterium]
MSSQFVRLKPEHGWVEFAKRSGDPPHVLRQYPAAIIPPAGQAESGIALPEFFRENLKRVSRYDSTLLYYPHRNAYVLRTQHYQSPLPEGVRTTLWWIYPDGRVEEIVSYTRDKSWPLANANSFIPARSGVYFIGADTTLTSYVGLYGLFRYYDDNKRRRVVAGRIGPWALSPDGCKLAFGNDDRWLVDGPRQYKLQVIDLCKGEKK